MQNFCITWKSLMQKFCKSYFLINSVHFPQQLYDAELLHLSQVAGKSWMQKFCKFHSPLNSILLLTTIVWCRNSASQPNGLKKWDTEILQILFSANFLHFLQLCDAEILHLSLVAWKRCMQKFCKFHFPLNSILLLTTIVWCRNSASQPNGLKKWDTEILQILFSAKFLHFLQLCDAEILHLSLVAWKRCMQKFCKFDFPLDSILFLQQLRDAQFLQILFFAKFHTFSTTTVWCKNHLSLVASKDADFL